MGGSLAFVDPSARCFPLWRMLFRVRRCLDWPSAVVCEETALRRVGGAPAPEIIRIYTASAAPPGVTPVWLSAKKLSRATKAHAQVRHTKSMYWLSHTTLCLAHKGSWAVAHEHRLHHWVLQHCFGVGIS